VADDLLIYIIYIILYIDIRRRFSFYIYSAILPLVRTEIKTHMLMQLQNNNLAISWCVVLIYVQQYAVISDLRSDE